MTVVIAAICAFILPNFPRTTPWLSEEEKQLAVWRLDEDIGQDDWVDSKHQSFFDGAKLAALDIKMWILVSYPPSRQSYFDNAADQMALDGHDVLHRRFRLGDQFLPHRRQNPRLQ